MLNILKNAKNPLVLAVGGGNDSVSTLLLQKQLQESFDYFPEKITVAAMLPDCLDYHNLTPTGHKLVGIIEENTSRSVQGYVIDAFPERVLTSHKNIIPTLSIDKVYGLSMLKGSVGISQALNYLVDNNNFDMILAIDVGGDFIAHDSNIEVLSPMMDGYMLYALKELEKYQVIKGTNIPVVYSIFGLGTDGESTPDMLAKALAQIPGIYEGQFNKEDVKPVIDFYRQTVEPNRRSRTTDFTIREIEETGHDNPSSFRGRFHVKVSKDEKAKIHYGVFNHIQDSYYFKKYYLFTDVSHVNNRFAIKCKSGIEWFLKVQKEDTKINHELNGQSYSLDMLFAQYSIYHGKTLFFGTPSRKFNDVQQKEIFQQVFTAVKNQVYSMAFIYSENIDIHHVEVFEHDEFKLLIDNKTGLYIMPINRDICIIGNDIELMEFFYYNISYLL